MKPSHCFTVLCNSQAPYIVVLVSSFLNEILCTYVQIPHATACSMLVETERFLIWRKKAIRELFA